MATLEQSIDVNVSAATAYALWLRAEDYPRFMEGVREVGRAGDKRLHWRAMRHEHEVEWDSEITETIPDQLIRWRDLGGQHHGSLAFEPLHAGQTRIHMRMEFDALPIDREQALTQRIAGDLDRFKRMAEQQGMPPAEGGNAMAGASVNASAGANAYASANAAGNADVNADATQSPVGKTVGQTGAEREEARASGTAGAQQAQAASGAHRESEQDGAGRSEGAGRGGPQAWLRSQFAGWEEPMALVRKVTEEADQLFARFIGRPIAAKSGEGGEAGKWMPPVEVLQRDDRLLICVDLPGISRDSVNVEVQRDRVLVDGERKDDFASGNAPGFRRSERSYGPFHRTVPLPEGVDPDSAQASMRDGVLEISLRMPSPAERRGKRLDIQD
ncbi:Hsp20 family protein [Noviherbaspirillum soli]|uniref:Hsp20 family protein n=1 Tax=Noviherbaspirillum soli TaxID=1064518 RepID=UPI00188B3DAE|nr:Hsp20 family protein [Noviherbaspirillum soli]